MVEAFTMNGNKAIEILFHPAFIAIIGIMFIIFHRQIGKVLYKFDRKCDSLSDDVSHMKTLFKYYRKAFMVDKIQYYHRAMIQTGIFLIIASIVITLFLWLWGVI